MKAGTQNRVQSRLLRVFLLQLALISFVTFAGVLAASWVAEKILVSQALVGEADYFWNQRLKNADFSVPSTLNLQGFLQGHATRDTPSALQNLAMGQQRVVFNGDEVIAHVSEQEGRRLTLLFQDETVANLGFYFGVVPLALVLFFVYGLAYMAYVLSRRAVSPISKLADLIENFDFSARDASELELGRLTGSHNSETLVLAEALQHFIERTEQSLERERNFARYASHELRTPVAVIQGSVSSLELLNLEGSAQRAVHRIQRASQHMGDLITSLLHLARNKADVDDGVVTNVNELVPDLLFEVEDTLDESAVVMNLQETASLLVNTQEATLRIVLGNLLRNAYMYTEQGQILVVIMSNAVSITDTGPGLTAEQQRRIFEPFYREDTLGGSGVGLGLALVKSTCENFDWELTVESEVGRVQSSPSVSAIL